MKKILLALLCALAGAGCFFGGQNDSTTAPTTVTPKGADTTAKLKSIKPGLYVGDYNWIDSNQYKLESEFNLNADGTYRLIYAFANDAQYDQSGRWAQRDSAFYFTKATDASTSNGYFSSYNAVQDDTNALASVTDTSFMRREWTPLRQRPYWITYVKRSIMPIKAGVYSLTKTYPVDSTTNTQVETRISFTGTDFLYRVFRDTMESYQAQAKWSQLGTFLITEENLDRQYVDSTKAFGAWDTLGGVIVTRLRTISDSAFQMWTSPSMFDTGSWDDYRIHP